MLYNITKDLAEKSDLSQQNPDLAKELSQLLTTQLKAVNADIPTKNTIYDPSKASSPRKRGGGRGKGGRGGKGGGVRAK